VKLPLTLLALAGLLTCGLRAEETARSKFGEVPHDYWKRPLGDAFTRLLAESGGALQLDLSSPKAELESLLKALRVPVSSQLLVYSATSFQSGLITPSNPRALYFNDEVYVGYVPGGHIEVAAVDPTLGPVFHLLRLGRGGQPQISRSERCMNCHAGRASRQVPGFFTESVICTDTGASLDGFRREQVGHAVPLALRLGGWHVTGAQAQAGHLGNLTGKAAPGGYERVPNPPGNRFDWERYPARTSDLFSHLLHEHQLGFHNLVTLAVYRTREAMTAGQGTVRPDDQPALDDLARQLRRYLLFADETALPPGGIQPDPAYAQDFQSTRFPARDGTSLRDLDLRTRLFRHRCSYLIHTPSFAALPPEFKNRLLAGLDAALRESGGLAEFDYLPAAEKRAIRTVLRDTGVLP
jgi:hypothetical protein